MKLKYILNEKPKTHILVRWCPIFDLLWVWTLRLERPNLNWEFFYYLNGPLFECAMIYYLNSLASRLQVQTKRQYLFLFFDWFFFFLVLVSWQAIISSFSYEAWFLKANCPQTPPSHLQDYSTCNSARLLFPQLAIMLLIHINGAQ
jgi:hypothetical protein